MIVIVALCGPNRYALIRRRRRPDSSIASVPSIAQPEAITELLSWEFELSLNNRLNNKAVQIGVVLKMYVFVGHLITHHKYH
jgi:hypothetical protein